MAAVLNFTVGHVVTSGVCFLKRLPLNAMSFAHEAPRWGLVSFKAMTLCPRDPTTGPGVV